MFNRKKESELLMDPIDRVLLEMEGHEPQSSEYDRCVDRLERLVRLNQEDRRRISPDTVLTVAGNILGILVIVAYEQKHVMASKGLGFILRPKN